MIMRYFFVVVYFEVFCQILVFDTVSDMLETGKGPPENACLQQIVLPRFSSVLLNVLA